MVRELEDVDLEHRVPVTQEPLRRVGDHLRVAVASEERRLAAVPRQKTDAGAVRAGAVPPVPAAGRVKGKAEPIMPGAGGAESDRLPAGR